MKLFKYLNDKKGIAETYRIYKVVQELKPYAISKYKSWWEDALDEAFFHILENYDSSKGDLKNYAVKIVGTIFLNKNRREVANDEKTILELDSQEAEDYKISDEEIFFEDDKSSELGECIADLVPYFVKDFKFFSSFQAKDRKLNYKELLSKYTYDTVSEARDFLVMNYSEKVSVLVDFSKRVTLKNFSEDRYLKSFDTGLEYLGNLNDIAIVRRGKGSHSKKLFRLPIKNIIDNLMGLFYCDEGCGKVVIEGIGVYVSIAGNIVVGEEEIRKCLEIDLVGSILSRTSLKVVKYDKGVDMILSSTKDHQYDVVLPMFDREVNIGFERVVCKEVS